MKQVRDIELLAPAKNPECGIEAIKHGADAVYIGADSFGARAAAGNSIEDIARLVEYAHNYYARVYVTVNTILKEEELETAQKLIWELYKIGVDAILVQDMAILQMQLPPIALHASTQADVRSVEKVRFLAEAGFSRVVLARELSLDEIIAIHNACPDVELECFVHGALCVSYSGQCYASQYCFGRSANRGECAQFCRLPFSVTDAEGNLLIQEKYPLSLRDMNRLQQIEKLLDAGVVSFKIEGRLKDLTYVKNVTAAYRKEIDKILKRRVEYARASSGFVEYNFEPQPEKSFNRGFTEYFLNGRDNSVWSLDTPKAVGEPMGRVRVCGRNWLTITGRKEYHNGDGLCFFSKEGKLHGYRVNKVDVNRIYLYVESGQLPYIEPGTEVFRNSDAEFDKLLQKESADRRIEVAAQLHETENGFTLSYTDENGNTGSAQLSIAKEIARTEQYNNICNQISKLGNTCFAISDINIDLSDNWFIPSSKLTELRRDAIDNLIQVRKDNFKRLQSKQIGTNHPYIQKELTYLGNVYNSKAKEFYLNHSVDVVADAFEKKIAQGAELMRCRHCIRYMLGECPKYHKKTGHKAPFYLRLSDGQSFRVDFDCARCEMTVSI